MLKKDGPIVKTPNGSLQFSPFLNIANRAMKQIKEFSAALGLSPADRVGLNVKNESGPPPESKAEKYFTRTKAQRCGRS